MIIEEAKPEDISEIIEVLRLSLGESELPVSQEVWQYKHEDNPFGKSIKLLAKEDGKIIGVRAFMAWEWCKGNQKMKAYRAVDTATHPNHRGKGIFKNLTLRAVELAKEEGASFIFNTPNEKSRPGYLKMGWEKVNNIEVGLSISWRSLHKINSRKKPFLYKEVSSPKELQDLCVSWNASQDLKDLYYTPKSFDYLKWRYKNNPLQEYQVFSSGDIFIAATVKVRKNLKELRIVESIYRKDNKKSIQEIRKIIRQWAFNFGVQVISFSPKLLPMGMASISGLYGPILTANSLGSSSSLEDLTIIQKWSYSLGDLELF